MKLLFVLLVAALAVSVQGQFRDECPPTNYTAITATQNLAILPPNGKYAICRPVGSSDTDPIEFKVTSGVFRLRDSQLIVDNAMSIVFEYPAYPDWTGSSISGFSDSQDQVALGNWTGVSVEGAPEADDRRRSVSRRSPYYYSHHVPTTGNCGRFENVNFDGVSEDDPNVVFNRCDGRTTIKKLSAFNGDKGLVFDSCNGVVAYDISVSGFGNGIDYDGVQFINSNVSLIRPIIFAEDDGIEVESNSHVTLCNPFISAGLTTPGSPIRMGTFDIMVGTDEPPVAVTVAGPSNLKLADDVTFRPNAQGLVAHLPKCPSKLAPFYSIKEWDEPVITP